MSRYWTTLVCALTALAVAGAPLHAGGKGKGKMKDLKFDGMLARDDPKDPKRNTPCKIHVVSLKKGQGYTIDMIGMGFDAYLRLEDNAGKQLAEDDDSGGNLNAQIIFNCTKDGDYKIYCTCVGNGSGKYILIIKATGALKTAAAHALLFDKAAPDFQADFALNGKAVKLSDLKGKVVLLEFWTVFSRGSLAAQPKLRDWHKRYKADGLEVVGLTYYNSELGHKFGFDSATGRLKDLAEASPETDREMLKAFAAYHKLEHVLLTLRKEQALKTFNDYLVNGLPQIVLIDRRGMVRSAYVGDAQVRNPDVEEELKKLLAEK
jgi:peroxiredoxin